MPTIVSVIVSKLDVEPGWPCVKPETLGKVYSVDVERMREAEIVNKETGQRKTVMCIWVVEPKPEGWMPTLIFENKP